MKSFLLDFIKLECVLGYNYKKRYDETSIKCQSHWKEFALTWKRNDISISNCWHRHCDEVKPIHPTVKYQLSISIMIRSFKYSNSECEHSQRDQNCENDSFKRMLNDQPFVTKSWIRWKMVLSCKFLSIEIREISKVEYVSYDNEYSQKH